MDCVTRYAFIAFQRILVSLVRNKPNIMVECIVCLLFLVLTVVSFAIYIAARKFLGSQKIENISKKYVLITGCDSGFGRHTAIHLDSLGFQVFATCLTKQGEDDLKRAGSQRIKVFLLDVTKSTQIQDVYKDVIGIIPEDAGLWALINNAGICIPGPVDWQPLDIYKHVADVNLWGVIDMTKTFLPLIRKAKGRIVNLASIAGRMSFTYMSSYCITKFGVETFSDVLRREVQPLGVKVVLIEPSAYKTGIFCEHHMKIRWDEQWNGLNEEAKNIYNEEYREQAYKAFRNTFSTASDEIEMVVNALEVAVTSKFPRNRYLVGLTAHVLAVITYLPSAIVDFLFSLAVPTIFDSANNNCSEEGTKVKGRGL